MYEYKMPADYLLKEVDKLYAREIDASNTQEIEKHIEFIQSFIEACGWSSDEYIRMIMNVPLVDNKSN